MTQYYLGKYKGRWAVMHGPTRVWYFPTKAGKKNAQRLLEYLNS